MLLSQLSSLHQNFLVAASSGVKPSAPKPRGGLNGLWMLGPKYYLVETNNSWYMLC